MKVPDYKDKAVFGVPLIVHVQRTGQPLPQSIQQALRYLRNNCLDQVHVLNLGECQDENQGAGKALEEEDSFQDMDSESKCNENE